MEKSNTQRILSRLMRVLVPASSLVLFALLVHHTFNQAQVKKASLREKPYDFKVTSFGFFVADMNYLRTDSALKAEKRVIALFPQNLQKSVKKFIRPTLYIAQKYQLDPFWVLSIMWTESHFKFRSLSPKGASGLMQVMPKTFKAILAEMKNQSLTLEGEKSWAYQKEMFPEFLTSFKPHESRAILLNIEVGVFYLNKLLKRFQNNYIHATVAYNMGPTWTRRRLNRSLPVGNDNKYMNKVVGSYFKVAKNIHFLAHLSLD